MLGIADRSRIIDLVRLIIDGKKEQALEESQEIFDLGADPKLVLQDMLEVIYLISRSKSFGKIENDLTVSESESDLIFSLSKDIDFSYISMIWQFILKGIEELSFVPNHFLSFQMLIMRLIHLKDLPSPEQLIDDVLSSDTVGISESNEQKDDFNEIKPGTIINKQTSAKTQIKSVIQEKTEEIDRTPKILEKKKELENFETILSGLNRLIFVEISLERDKDDPQRIFESLNSTGLDLSQSDLIRNFILMTCLQKTKIEFMKLFGIQLKKTLRIL